MSKLAALPIRRKASKEKQIYEARSEFDPSDYEILLRQWPAEPYLNYLAAFSGPLIEGTELEITLLQQLYQWSKQLAVMSGHSDEKGLKGLKAVFLSITGDRLQTINGDNGSSPQFITFVVPLTNLESRVTSIFPTDNSRFPQFHCLGRTLAAMYNNEVNIHPSTREMLSLLSKWLYEQHFIPHSINQLFHLPCDSQVNTVTKNPLHYDITGGGALKLSNEYHTAAHDYENWPVDIHVVNPYYNTDIQPIDKPNMQLVNPYFGLGEPDYYAIGTKPVKYAATVENEEDIDWVDKYPLHKAACENNVAAIRRLAKQGINPNIIDGDGWSPLHYACWYGEIEAVKSLIEDCLADVDMQNENGSTPLHFAAGKGRATVVEYLLIETPANPGALDNEGRSPLAICLECKENQWRATEHMIRDALREFQMPYNRTPFGPDTTVDTSVAVNEPMEEESGVNENLETLGSLGNMLEAAAPSSVEKNHKKQNSIMRLNVNAIDGHSGVVPFFKGKNSPALEVLQEACYMVELSLDFQFVFALWIVSKSLAIQLGDTDKPLKLLEKWPNLLSRFSSSKDEIPSIELRRNVFFPSAKEKNITDPKTLEILYNDAKCNVLNGRYCCSEEECIDLATITMQLNHGDHNSSIHVSGFLRDQLTLLIPSYRLNRRNAVYLERQILAKHSTLSEEGYSNVALYQMYLEYCRRWPFYGATFYEGQMTVKTVKHSTSSLNMPPVKPGRKYTPVRIGINNLGFHIVNKSNNTYLQSYPLEDMEWDMSKEKNIFMLQSKTKSLMMTFKTKQTPLLHSLAEQMHKELLDYKNALKKQQKVKRVRTKS